MFYTALFQLLIWPAAIIPIGDPHAALLTAIQDLIPKIAATTRYTKIPYFELGFPTLEAQDAIALTGEQKTTEKTVTLALPSGAVYKEATLVSTITALNNSATAQKIDVTVEARKGAGSYSTYFSQDDIIGFGAVDGATNSLSPFSNLTTLIDDVAASYGFRCSINQSSANSVIYTIQHVLIISFALS